ncbi:MAG TPA: hypothetical protein VGX94_10480 [Terriglobia bacterium]|nr:hypothetical protein [Terriglobia bacterium]
MLRTDLEGIIIPFPFREGMLTVPPLRAGTARPYYYAKQTATKAMTNLGMTKQPGRTAKTASISRESETGGTRS